MADPLLGATLAKLHNQNRSTLTRQAQCLGLNFRIEGAVGCSDDVHGRFAALNRQQWGWGGIDFDLSNHNQT
jgi:hypothetical protein